MVILQRKGENPNLHIYIRVYPSIHLHISLDTHFNGAQPHTNLLGLVLRASATAASAPEVNEFVP